MRSAALDDAATAASSVHNGTVDHVLTMLGQAVRIGTEFKRSETVFNRRSAPEELRDRLLTDLSANGTPLEQLLEEFSDSVLPWCKNESSPRFMGFADTGDDLAALTGEILSVLTQQNMINQGFDAPTATFVEIAVLRRLRDLLGYPNPAPEKVESVWDVGGIVTTGGTMSNTVAMMLARETNAPGTMHGGVTDPERFTILVPAGIGHYSVNSALPWIGVGAQLVEVATQGFRYDLGALRDALQVRPGRVMAVVAYAGDSRTQTVDHLAAVHDVVRAEDPTIWLHADACWGLLAAFNDRLTSLLEGIADFDSITVDPHKVMAVPTASALFSCVNPKPFGRSPASQT